MVISEQEKNNNNKVVYVENIVESLDKAISDFAKVDLQSVIKKSTKTKKAKSSIVQKEAGYAFVPDNLPVMIEEVETVNAIEVYEPKEIKASKSSEGRKAKKITKKASKINGFFTKGKATASKSTKNETRVRRVKSRYFSANIFSNKLSSKAFNIFSVHKKSLGTGVLAVMMLFFVSATTYVAYAYMTSANNDLVNSVAKHMILPTGETPKVYIVQSEKADLFNNPLFAGIKVGDNVLTYTGFGKVIIYRASEDKIVNVVSLK